MALELPGGVKVLNPDPVDGRMRTQNLFNPTGDILDLRNDPTLYVGFFPIYDAETESQYMVTGGSKDVGWTFTMFSGTRIDQEIPSAGISLNTQQIVEVGSTINPIVTPSFSKNDGGDLTEVRIYKDGVLISTQYNLNPYQEPSGFKVVNGRYTYQIEVDYDNSDTVPYGTANAETFVDALHASYSGTVEGSWSGGDIKVLDKSFGTEVLLDTGTDNTTFLCAVPKDYYDVVRVTDGEAGGFNIIDEYTESEISLVDVGGDFINYAVYELQTMIPYSLSRDHVFTLKDK